MSTKSAAMLAHYNKKSPYKRQAPIDTRADKSFGTWSYANMYDALYDKFSQNQNFNVDMWHQAIKLGEQDQYLALLEQNKDNKLNDRFYDPQYYDYESMMMELYLPLADNTKLEKYTQDVFDPVSGKYVTEDLGEMTQHQYYEYLLNANRAAREQEITLALEQERKDQMSDMQKLGPDVLATLGEFSEGIVGALAGMVDFFVGIGFATGYSGAALLTGDEENQNWLDAFVNYFGEIGLTANEKETLRASLDEYERTHTHFRDINGNMIGIGKYVAGIANSMGMMIPAIVTNAATGGLAWVGQATFYTSIFSGNMYENATNTDLEGPSGMKIFNAALKTGAEAVIEYGLGQLLGGTIQNQMIGIGGRTAFKGMSKMTGLGYFFKSAGQEGLEEFLQDFSTNLVDQFMSLIDKGYGNTGVTLQTLIDSFFIGALSSMFMSGGAVAKNAISSAVRNKRTPGSGDMVIEVDGKIQKVTGLNRLYYRNILSDFQKAVETLKKGKISSAKNIELAQEVYGAISAISQYYSSFDTERIKRCEMLLDRVVKAERSTEYYGKAAAILSSETMEQIAKSDKNVKTQINATVRDRAQTLGKEIESTFRSMLGDVALRHAAKLHKVVDEAKEKLAEADVTTANTFTDTDGIKYNKDPEMADIEERLGKKAANTLNELRKGYEWVITVDGHIAYESDGYLFVSEAWLQNYQLSDIYKYLEQTRVLEALTSDKTLVPMLKKLITFDKEFTGQESVSPEHALMDFLFNESVYQAFLLSNAGKNMHDFKNFIFQFHSIIKDLAQRSKYHQQLFKGKQAQPRINMLNKIYEQIKNTMRKPTIVAMLNWGIDPQSVGADSVLNERDKQVIAQYQQRRRVIANEGKEGKHSSRYENLAKDIIPKGQFTDIELALIKKSLAGNATLEEDIEARLLLDEADARMTIFDFDVSARYSFYLSTVTRIIESTKELNFVEDYKTAKEQFDGILDFTEEFLDDIREENLPDELRVMIDNWYEKVYDNRQKFDFRNTASFDGKPFWSGSVDLLDGTIEETHKYEEAEAAGFHHSLYFSPEQVDKMARGDAAFFWVDNGVVQGEWRDQVSSDILARINEQIIRDTSNPMVIASSGAYILKEYCLYLKDSTPPNNKRQIGLGALTIPHQVAASIMRDGDIAGGQFVTDVLKEFQKMYGIDARQMIMGDMTGMSMAQRNQLTQDMGIVGADNLVTFVIRKLEGMLGDKYIVAPTKRQVKRAMNGTFSVMAFNDVLSSEPISALKQVKKALTNWYTYVERRIGRMSETVAQRELEKITEVLYTISPRGYSVLRDYLPTDATTFVQDWSKIERNTESNRDVVRWLITQKERLNDLLESIEPKIGYTDTLADTEIYDFIIARSIPAERVISHDILDLETKQRNELFENLFYGNTIGERQLMYFRGLLRGQLRLPRLYQRFSKEWNSTDEQTIEYLNELLNMSDTDATNYLGTLMEAFRHNNSGDIVNPHTGEVLEDSAFGDFLKNVIQAIQDSTMITNEDGSLPLSAFIDTNAFADIDLSNITVALGYAGENTRGVASGNKIIISRTFSDDYFATLVHEVNHILQSYYNLPNGFNPESAELMSDFLVYVANNFSRYVAYSLRRGGYDVNDYGLTLGKITEKQIKRMPEFLRKEIAYCAYRLVQGEIWARTYMHNGKQVHGFAEIWQGFGNSYLLAPDGKTRFKVQLTKESSSDIKPKISPELAGSALDVAIQKLFFQKWEQDKTYGIGTQRDTYHSYLTKKSSTELTRSIMSDDVPLFQRYSVRLNDIIRDPQSYLAPEILARCNNDFSEGNVFYRLKEYIEANSDGVSIDINERQEYIWVDDNAFDDTLLTGIRAKRNSQENTITKQYKVGEHIPLSRFYAKDQLDKLGINPTAYIVFRENNGTETIFDWQHRTGAIAIDITRVNNDADFVNQLNHEFRHLLQYYNGFATGFTADFKVTKEMLADIKKHLPGLFKNAEIVKWAKKVATNENKNYEEVIAQRYVYYAASGELTAYAFEASDLYAKPVFIKDEGGNPTIFMSWYDPKTGEGMHETDFFAMKSENTEKPKKPKVDLPKVDKRPKHDAVKVESLDDVSQITYVYNKRRDFTNAKAEGTNLKYFVKKGKRNQMDPDLQEFVIATTGYEDELPPELWNAIKKGILTKQALFKWFRNVKSENVNDFTFDLLNKYMFKNDYIKNMEQLDAMLVLDPSFYWAATKVLRKDGLSLEALLAENDVNKFLSFINSLEGTKWKAKIEKKQTEFSTMWIRDSRGEYKLEDVAYSDKIQNYMRVLAMQWFDGTLAGAFYVAGAFRKTIRKYEEEVRGVISIDATRGNAKGDKELSLEDTLSEDDVMMGDDTVGNDLIAIYEQETQRFDRTEEEMIQELSVAYYNRLCEKNGINPERESQKTRLVLAKYVIPYQNKLSKLSLETLTEKYAAFKNSQITDTQATFSTKETQTTEHRVSIVNRIKSRANKLLKYIREGKISFAELPKDVQDMFEQVEATTDKGKKIQGYELKSDVYSVGGGRAKLKGLTDKTGRINYATKHNITEGTDAFKHDTSTILANLERLDETVKAADQVIKQRQGNVAKTVARGEKSAQSLINAIRNQKVPKDNKMKQTEFKMTKKKKRTSDTPNVFNIVSGIDMPHVLYKILDTSFEDLANTEVQFASRDENGQLYNKEQFKPGEFDSRLKHEVSNWDAFYEANRDALITLSRNDVLDIIAFFQSGAQTIDGPTNKFAAFEIFILGYFVDAARHNINNWDFSESEIDLLERLYEQKASAHGSGLNAVKQMLKVVDPMKKVRQRMFNDWDAISDGDKDDLIEAVDALQAEKDPEAQRQKAEKVMQMLNNFCERQIEADEKKYPRWSRAWWSRRASIVKSYRYMAMLSGPTTWIRNVLSNYIVAGFNKTSDFLGKAVFAIPKKGYMKDQWNLAGTKISSEAKSFIDTYILSNPIFDPLYDLSSKYDPRQNKKVIDERGLLTSLIVKAYEKRYNQDRRFDTETMNNIAKFIDARISDKKFVKRAAGRYFGKILTIEAERGNVDLSKGLSNEAMDLFAESVILANIDYMHKRSFAADMLDGIRDKHPKLHEVLTFWQPFLNSSFNWFAESFKYTPFGLANAIVRSCKLEQQIAKLNERREKGEMVADSRATQYMIRRDIGKGITGLILSGFGIMLAAAGRIRIDEDDDKFYLFVDDEIKLDITNIFGSSSVLAGASIAQKWIEQSDGEVATWEEVISLVTDTILDGFIATDLLERHKWGGTWDDLLTETESVMRSFVPQAWQTIIACTNKESIRYSPGFAGMWERWLNTFVPTQPLGNRKINPYTGAAEDKYSLPIIGGVLQKGILGPKIYWVDVDEVERMSRELGVNKNELTGELTIDGKKYELDRLALNTKYGELNKESLAKIKSQKHYVKMPDGKFKTLSWDKMSDEQRANVVSRTMVQNAEIAKIYIWTQNGHKVYVSESMWGTLRKLGITQNVYKGDKGFVE